MSSVRGASMWVLGIALYVYGGNAFAGPVIDGSEWYQPVQVTQYAWSDFNAICPGGPCSGRIGGTGPDLSGWVWASVQEVGDLFHATTPHPGGVAAYYDTEPFADPYWAFDFLSLFDETVVEPVSPGGGGGIGVVGLTSSTDVSGSPYWGVVAAYVSGWWAPGVPEVDGTARTEIATLGTPDSRIGAWLYRADPTRIPLPATVDLVGIALAVMAWRMKRAAWCQLAAVSFWNSAIACSTGPSIAAARG